MTKVDLAGMISEEAEKQALEPKETLGGQMKDAESVIGPNVKLTTSKAKKRPRSKKDEPEPEPKKTLVPRRTAWLREDHLDRLEILKRRERARLRDDPEKRAAVTSLIDEAIEKYLAEME